MGRFANEVAKEAAQTRPGPTCAVRRFLDALKTDAERHEVQELIAGSASAMVLAKAFKNLGYDLTANRIAYHRRGECRCVQQPR